MLKRRKLVFVLDVVIMLWSKEICWNLHSILCTFFYTVLFFHYSVAFCRSHVTNFLAAKAFKKSINFPGFISLDFFLVFTTENGNSFK